MLDYLTVSEAAQEAREALADDVPPRLISDLIYQRILDVERCPMLGGRRIIERGYLPTLLSRVRQHRQSTRDRRKMKHD
jgi:hypothetical protein